MKAEHPIRIYRTKHKLTQGQMAERLGVSDATITHIETGRRPVTPKNAIEWEARLGLSRHVLCPEIFGAAPEVGAETTATETHQEAG